MLVASHNKKEMSVKDGKSICCWRFESIGVIDVFDRVVLLHFQKYIKIKIIFIYDLYGIYLSGRRYLQFYMCAYI